MLKAVHQSFSSRTTLMRRYISATESSCFGGTLHVLPVRFLSRFPARVTTLRAKKRRSSSRPATRSLRPCHTICTMTRNSPNSRSSWLVVGQQSALRSLGHLNALGIITLIILIGLWEVLIDVGVLQLTSLPSPSAISRASWPVIHSGQLFSDLGYTLRVTLTGWVIASVGGIALGLVLGLWRPAWEFSMASIEVMRGIPGIAFLMVAVVLFGLSTNMELFIVVYVAMWPVLVNTVAGVRSVSRTHADLAALLRISGLRRIKTIVLPSSMSHVVVALRIALAAALSLAVVAEMIGNPQGAGYRLILAQQGLRPERVFTYVIAIGVLGVLLNSTFMMCLRVFAPGTNHVLREKARD